MGDLVPSIDAQLESYKMEKNAFDKVEISYQKTVQKLDDAQNERWELQRKLTNDRSLFDRTEALVDDKEIAVGKLLKVIADLQNEEKTHSSSQAELKRDKKEAEKNLSIAKTNLKKADSKLTLLKSDQDSISEEKHAVSAQVQSLTGQREFYSELLESREGFPEGARYVLENPRLFPGVIGTVADMFQVDDEYRDALESGLGDLSHCLIAIDKKEAISTLEKARENQAGDFTVIPLKEATKLKTDLKNVPRNKLLIKRASDLVKTSKELEPLARYLLGNLIIVTDLQKSRVFSDEKQFIERPRLRSGAAEARKGKSEMMCKATLLFLLMSFFIAFLISVGVSAEFVVFGFCLLMGFLVGALISMYHYAEEIENPNLALLRKLQEHSEQIRCTARKTK